MLAVFKNEEQSGALAAYKDTREEIKMWTSKRIVITNRGDAEETDEGPNCD